MGQSEVQAEVGALPWHWKQHTLSRATPPQSISYIRLCLALSGGGESVFSEVSGWGLAQFVDRGQHALTHRSQPRI